MTSYDTEKIINRIIQNLKLDSEIYDENGKDNKIPKILFGDPYQQDWLSIQRPYIAIAPGDPFEIFEESFAIAKRGEQSPSTKITLQFFITAVFDATLPEDALKQDLKFRTLLKNFFRKNPKLHNSTTDDDDDPLFHRSKTTITPKYVRGKMDSISAFTVVFHGDLIIS